jgi:ribose 5-phosphate isomerase B
MIILGADHGGFELKEKIKEYFESKDIKFVDNGSYENDDLDNFPEIAIPLAQKVANGEFKKGILVCGSGVGVCMAANRIKGVRAVNAYSNEVAKLSRQHNNSNVLCLGGRLISEENAKDIINTWLNTEFLGGKYQARNEMLDNI